MGVVAIMLLMASFGTSLYYIGPRAALSGQQAGPYQTEAVRKAIHTFVAKSFRLPCPADGTITASTTGAGLEQTSGATCTIPGNGKNGVVPWKTLGLSYQDAVDRFGTQLGYAVSNNLAAPSLIPTASNSFLTTPGSTLNANDSISVESCATSTAGSTTCAPATAQKYAYMVISYGSDGIGGYLQSGQQKAVSYAATYNEYANTQNNAFAASSGAAFQVWPSDVQNNAGAAYFNHVLIYETAEQLINDLNNGADSSNNASDNVTAEQNGNNQTYGNPNSNSNAPAAAASNSSVGAQAANSGTITNTYSCTTGSTFCPGSTNAGSGANTYGYSGCSGNNSCTGSTTGVPASQGECLILVGNLGETCIHDPVAQSGLFVGYQDAQNSAISQNGDWIGPDDPGDCAECFSSAAVPNYTVPTQALTYNLTSSYRSFAFADYLVDGGMQIQVDAYQAQTYAFTGTVSGTTTIASPSSTTGLQIGQTIINTTCFPNFTYITSLSPLTVSQSANAACTGATPNPTFIAIQNSYHYTASTTASSQTLTITTSNTENNDFSSLVTGYGFSTGWAVTGPGIPAGTIVTATSPNVTISQAATATLAGVDLTFSPWTHVGTQILSNGYLTNVPNATTISGVTAKSSTSISNVSPANDLAVGQMISGYGITPGTVITAVTSTTSGTTLTLSQPTTAASPAAPSGSGVNVSSATGYFFVATSGLVTSPITGTVNATAPKEIDSLSSTAGLVVGTPIAGNGIPAGTVVSTISGTTITISQSTTVAGGTTISLLPTSRQAISGITGTLNGTTGVASVATSSADANVNSTNGYLAGDYIDSPAFPGGTQISTVGTTSLTLSNATTYSQTGAPLFVIPQSVTLTGITGDLTNASTTISNVMQGGVNSTVGLLAGEPIAATGLNSGTFIQSVNGTAFTITLSQAANSQAATGASLVIGRTEPIIGTTGTTSTTSNPNEITSVSPSGTIAAGDFVFDLNVLQYNTSVTSVTTGATDTLNLSQNVTGTQTNAALSAGFTPPATGVTLSGTFSDGVNPDPSNTLINSVSVSALPGVGTAINGADIPSGTMVSSVDGTTASPGTITMTQGSNLTSGAGTPTASFQAVYPACPGPPTTAGLYGATGDPRSDTTPFAPIVQHPSATVAATIPSQIWPQPGTSGNSVNSNDTALTGNYVDQRDYQFGNIQFSDSNGNALAFNVLVFQVLPYTYTTGSYSGTTFTDYGMLFEGAAVCPNDANSGRCTMMGIDEWWNPPVYVTADCSQLPQ